MCGRGGARGVGASLRFELVGERAACSGRRLVGRHRHLAEPALALQRREHDGERNRHAVRVGDDAVMRREWCRR